MPGLKCGFDAYAWDKDTMKGFSNGGCRIKKGDEWESTEKGYGDCCYKPS